MLKDSLQSGTNRHRLSPPEHLSKRSDSRGDSFGFGSVGADFAKDAEPPAGLAISEQVLVAESEERAAQDAD